MSVYLRDLNNRGVQFCFNSENITGTSFKTYVEPPVIDFNNILPLCDEAIYDCGTSFTDLAKQMISLDDQGKVKKKVILEGTGDFPKALSTVHFFYNIYIENQEEACESNYTHREPKKIVIADGRILPGMDLAVQSMKLNEKSQFLIHPDYAYANCLVSNIPPNSTILFEVEIVQIIDTATIKAFEKLSPQDQEKFSEIYIYCEARLESGRLFTNKHDYKSAIKEFNKAVSTLEKSTATGKEETTNKKELLYKLYLHLLVYTTKNADFKKGCVNAQKIYDLTNNGEFMELPARVFYNHAKCLRYLQDFNKAKYFLNKAHAIEPKNPEIAKENAALEKDMNECKKNEKLFASCLVGNVPKK